MRVPKTIKFFLNYFMVPLLFGGLLFSIYKQIKQQPHLSQSWEGIKNSFLSYKISYLALATVLIFINWGLEAKKWQWLVSTVRPTTFFLAYKAVLSGVSFSMALPNRIGEYIGRILYEPEGSRLKTVSLAIVGSMSQLLATLFWGCIGLVLLKKPLLAAYPQTDIWFQAVLYGLLFCLLGLVALYFKVSKLVFLINRWPRVHKYAYLVTALQKFNAAFLMKLFLLSSIRYSVFLAQYMAIFYLFQVDVPVTTIMVVMSVVFLTLAVIPSIALLEVGLRGQISLQLMGLFSINHLGIGLTSVTIWFINLILPALIGTLFLLNIKLLKER